MLNRKLEEQCETDNGALVITPSIFGDIPREEQRESKAYPRQGLQSVRQEQNANR